MPEFTSSETKKAEFKAYIKPLTELVNKAFVYLCNRPTTMTTPTLYEERPEHPVEAFLHHLGQPSRADYERLEQENRLLRQKLAESSAGDVEADAWANRAALPATLGWERCEMCTLPVQSSEIFNSQKKHCKPEWSIDHHHLTWASRYDGAEKQRSWHFFQSARSVWNQESGVSKRKSGVSKSGVSKSGKLFLVFFLEHFFPETAEKRKCLTKDGAKESAKK